ncbi:hypothetical protein JTB14_018500 [Gonioctena quinquepunctata]|nr:hypothetical protein JTB14_018500 [Gonioctena quinquepunctata]
MGLSTTLTKDEEANLEKWILSKAILGFLMHSDKVKDSVQRVLKFFKRPNMFTDDRPGEKWLKLFLQRHPKVTQRNTEIISKGRASVTEEGIRTWFRELEDYLISLKTKKTNSKTKTKKIIDSDATEGSSGSSSVKYDSLETKDENVGEEKNLSISGQSGSIIGSYVIIIYDKKPFPGIIKNIEGDGYEVQTMCKIDGRNYFKWPSLVDQIWYNKTCVSELIAKPRLIRRGIFELKEIQKYLRLVPGTKIAVIIVIDLLVPRYLHRMFIQFIY